VAADQVRVLYSFAHPYGSQGIGTTARAQVEGLRSLGVQVDVWCTSIAPGTPAAGCRTTMTAFGRRIPLRTIGLSRAWRFHDHRVATELRRNPGHYSLVHGWPLASAQTFEAARALGVPTFRELPNTHTAHAFEVVSAEYRRLGLDAPRGFSHRPDAERLAREEREYQLADRLLAPSEPVAGTFLDRGFDREQIGYQQYGYDPTRFQARRAEPHDRLEAIFVGSCDGRKGLHFALEAWERSGAGARGRFRICGRFAPGYEEILGRRLRLPGVEVLGPRSEVADLMGGSDVLVLPSVEEGSALVTYEAMASGCALLVSDAAGAHAEHAKEALVHAVGDVELLSEHLRSLSDDPTLLMSLRTAALERSRSLTWTHAARRLLDTYREHLPAEATAGR